MNYRMIVAPRKFDVLKTNMLVLKEHYHVFAHAQEFDFWTGG